MKLVRNIFRYLSYFCLLCLILMVVVLMFLSPITKYLIERYDEQYTGRQIEMKDLTLDIFNGRIIFTDLKVYEKGSHDIFFSAHQFYIGMRPLKAVLHQEYEITALSLSRFYIQISQKGSHFNFDDLTQLGKDTSTAEQTPPPAEPVKWWVNKIQLKNGHIIYKDELVKTTQEIETLNISSPGLSYNNADMQFLTDFRLNKTGLVKADFKMNNQSMKYALVVNIQQLPLESFYNYLTEFIRLKALKGSISTAFQARGSFRQSNDLAFHGNLSLDNLDVTDILGSRLASIKQLEIIADSVNLQNSQFKLSSIKLLEPYVKVELYDNGTNFDRLLVPDSTAQTSGTRTTATVANASKTNIFIDIANYIKSIATDFILNSYSADKVCLTNGQVDYEDFTLGERFHAKLDSLTILSDRISSNHDRISALVKTHINSEGRLDVEISTNPKDFLEMDLGMNVKNVPITMFNPYTRYYLAYPFEKGGINFNTATGVDAKHKLKSDNHLLVGQVNVGKKDKTCLLYTSPSPRDRG